MRQNSFWTQNRHLWDLVGACLVAVIGAAAALNPSTPLLLRTALTIPLLFYLPGYGIVAAAFPRTTLQRLERIIFSVGVSVAVTAVIGLLLNFTVGMAVEAWAIALTSLTVVGCLLATLRRPRYVGNPSRHLSTGLNIVQYLMLGLALVMGLVAFNLVRQSVMQERPADYTSFWMLPSAESPSGLVRLGIKNVESKVITYQIKLEQGTTEIRTWKSITVRPGETWEETASVPILQVQGKMIEAYLYRLDDPAKAYRHVTLWMPAAPTR